MGVISTTTSAVHFSSIFPIKLLDGQGFPFHKNSVTSFYHKHKLCPRHNSVRVLAMTQSSEPRKITTHLNNLRDRLWKEFSEPVKEMPWKKAEEKILQRLSLYGKSVLKWSLIVLFISSCLSDVTLALSRNKELIIPFGLFVGCILADFLKELSQQFFIISQDRESKWHFIGISFLFVVVKVLSTRFSLGGQVFLSHVGNGGLLQVIWLWKKLREEGDNSENETSSLLQDSSISTNAGA